MQECEFRNILLVCGGNKGFTIRQTCERYNFKTASWENDLIRMPVAVRGAPAVTDEKRNLLYIIGGCVQAQGGLKTNKLQAYDPGQNQWKTMAPMQTSRCFSSATLFGDFGHDSMVVCGGWASTGSVLALCEQYLLDEDQWVTFAPLRQARFNHGMANFKGRLYVFGGDPLYQVGSIQLLDTIEEYDAMSGEWHELKDCRLPKPMDDFATVVYYE